MEHDVLIQPNQTDLRKQWLVNKIILPQDVCAHRNLRPDEYIY